MCVNLDPIDPVRKWRANLNMNARLRMYEYCYLNLSAVYAKGLFSNLRGEQVKRKVLVLSASLLLVPLLSYFHGMHCVHS